MLCPPVFESNAAIDDYRARVDEALDRYLDVRLPVDVGRLHASRAEPPADWIYQGRDDLPLKQKYARLFAGAFPAHLRELRPRRPTGRQPHLGFVVTPGHEGVFMRCMRGILNRLSGRKFRLTLICAGGRGHLALRHDSLRRELHALPLPTAAEHIRPPASTCCTPGGRHRQHQLLPAIPAPRACPGHRLGLAGTSAAPDYYERFLALRKRRGTPRAWCAAACRPTFARRSPSVRPPGSSWACPKANTCTLSPEHSQAAPRLRPILRGILEADPPVWSPSSPTESGHERASAGAAGQTLSD
jgi:hypothetical protein